MADDALVVVENLSKRFAGGESPAIDRLSARVEPGHKGQFLVLDVETGDYEIDADRLVATQRIRTRHPDGEFFMVRIGYPAVIEAGWELSRQLGMGPR